MTTTRLRKWIITWQILEQSLDVIVNQVESQYELCNLWATRAERLQNLLTYVSSSKMLVFFFLKVRKHKLKLKSSGTLRKSTLKSKSRTKRYCSLFFCNRVMCLYKSETHVLNYCKLKLSADIEKNPCPHPMYVDPSKTIAAPCSQSNELVFGQNVGQQYVAMSSCSLINNNKQGISSANDLIQIMKIGNQWYSGLSQLDRHSYLMGTE